MSNEPLQVDVYVAPIIPAATGNLDPEKCWWSPICCTLIQGSTSAVLVDTPITVQQTIDLANWIEKMHQPIILERFRGTKLVATDAVAVGIKEQYESWYEPIWNTTFKGQLAEDKPEADGLPMNNEFILDGHTLRAIDVVHGDCARNSVLHVPSLDLVVAGDVVYGDCYQYLAEANTAEKRQQWIDALTMIEDLNPKIVVPGHKRATQVDGVYLLQATKAYISAFGDELNALLSAGLSGEQGARALEAKMKQLYPNRWNDYILELSCLSAFGISA